MSDDPKLSVIMGVYNADPADLKASIESILNQSFTDFEFIIINDGSTNETPAILKSYAEKDSRIRLIDQENKGLTRSLNIGAGQARGLYIARQDADDVSYLKRFELQIDVMDKDLSCVLVGGNCDDIYPDGHKDVWGHYGDDELQRIVYFKTPFAHSTALMRAEAFRALGGYNETYRTAQDMELWMRFAGHGRLAMIAEPVLLRKIDAGSISNKRRWRQFRDAFRARWTHNRGLRRARAVYHALRSLLIGLLPHGVIRILKGKRA